MTPALLALADGRVFRGLPCGAGGEASGEVVFNTSMTGYQEILTDPSYRGQMVCMTYPLIGNYGISPEDAESRRPWVNGFIVKEACGYPSNWRGRMRLDDYLREHGIVAIQGIDTRALTRHLRDRGAQEGIISTVEADADRLVERARAAFASLVRAAAVTVFQVLAEEERALPAGLVGLHDVETGEHAVVGGDGAAEYARRVEAWRAELRRMVEGIGAELRPVDVAEPVGLMLRRWLG